MEVDLLDEKMFELMEKMYSDFSKRFDNIEVDIKDLKTEVGSLKVESKKVNSIIEHELMDKIEALFDGYIQNTDKLDRIEKEVSKHEEVILRRIK